MEISCRACAITADATLGIEGYTIALPPCFTLRCPEISKSMMQQDGSGCDECVFMQLAAERVFVNYLTRQ